MIKMNKKWLTGFAGAGVVAATFGFAASIGTINTESIGGADAAVAACTEQVDVTYDVSWDETAQAYLVDAATVDVSGDASNTCEDGDPVGVTVQGDSGADGSGSGSLSASDDATVTLDGGVQADDLNHVHVVIGGVAVN